VKVLFLITARGGSKRIPGKNLRRIAGLSLVAFKAIAAQRSRYCARLAISSEDRAIQEEARRYHVDVPFTRPEHLASDSATSVNVIGHALDYFEAIGERYDAVMLLEPSAPFARPADYDSAIELMMASGATVVLGMKPVPNRLFTGPVAADGSLPEIVSKVQAWEDAGRPSLHQEFTMNGALYLVNWQFFREHRRIYHNSAVTRGYVMDPHYSIEIDEPMDLRLAEFFVASGAVDLSYWQ
jgi:CMP-N,N'-diacetyllegionaminic acid synthase